MTTLDGLRGLDKAYAENGCDIISISGGGDPLFEYEKHLDWYQELFQWAQGYRPHPVPIDMHTSYLTEDSLFPFYKCHRVVYHANTIKELEKIHRIGKEIVRIVYVVTEDFTPEMIMDIAGYVKQSDQIDELSFRQLVGNNYETKFHLHEYLKSGHKKLWWYIEQNDYNLYYAENKIYTEYREIGRTE